MMNAVIKVIYILYFLRDERFIAHNQLMNNEIKHKIFTYRELLEYISLIDSHQELPRPGREPNPAILSDVLRLVFAEIICLLVTNVIESLTISAPG